MTTENPLEIARSVVGKRRPYGAAFLYDTVSRLDSYRMARALVEIDRINRSEPWLAAKVKELAINEVFRGTTVDASECVFCELGRRIRQDDKLEVAFTLPPLNPVTKGHLLVIPFLHVTDATIDPALTAEVMGVAAKKARELAPCNIITSVGQEATQSVFHLHLHIVPRHEGDGLALPWTKS